MITKVIDDKMTTTATTNGTLSDGEESEWDENESWEWATESEEEDDEDNENNIKVESLKNVPPPPPPPPPPQPFLNNKNEPPIPPPMPPQLSGSIIGGGRNMIKSPLRTPSADKPKPNIHIEGNLVKIDRNGPVDWSDDEYDDSDEYIPPMPPPMPPKPTSNHKNSSPRKRETIENLKKRSTVRPDWKDLMSEIENFRHGFGHLLNKVKTDDRSQPILANLKIGNKFVYESEKDQANKDILKDIQKGVRLKHVKTNDRSRPNLRGIRTFKRQTTKEDRLKGGFMFDDVVPEEEEDDDIDALKDDLESTKQLLELEIRSKKLLEKDNKRMQQEMEKLKQEFAKMSTDPNYTPVTNSTSSSNIHESFDKTEASTTPIASRKSSMQMKRQSMIRMLSETGDIPELGDEVLPKGENEEEEERRKEVEEARKLAEEWETKYKEMQRQMSELDGGVPRSRRHYGEDGQNEKKMSTTSDPGIALSETMGEDEDEESWMLRREVNTLRNRLKNMSEKKEVLIRERNLLHERTETLINSISSEVEARKRLRKEIRDMNEAFKIEIDQMISEETTAAELEDCYYSDEEELVANTCKRKGSQDSSGGESELLDDPDEDLDETIEDILNLATEDEDQKRILNNLFDREKIHEIIQDEDNIIERLDNHDDQINELNGLIEKHTNQVHTMRKSNFEMKSKIDHLYDILQMQKEKHHDLKQELTRMLADIQ